MPAKVAPKRASVAGRRPSVSQDAEEEVDQGPVKPREVMLKKLDGGDWLKEREDWNRVMHQEPAHEVATEAIKSADKEAKQKKKVEMEARKMKRFNNVICLKIMVMGPQGSGGTLSYYMDTQASVYLNKLHQQVVQLVGIPKKHLKLMWLSKQGETSEIDSQRTLDHFQDVEWCTQPWVLFAHDSRGDGGGSKSKKGNESASSSFAISLDSMAKDLFDRYDVNNNGTIDRSELRRMLVTVDERALGVSVKLVERFIDAEFSRVDTDASGEIDAKEFTRWVTSMTAWLRDELMSTASHRNVFATLASRAIEVRTPPAAAVGLVDTGRFGLKLDVPAGALGEGGEEAKISIKTLAPTRLAYLSESEKRRRGEFAFSLAVVIDYPATADGKPDSIGGQLAKPLTLTMPHCFSTSEEEATESCVMLGAPHGATQWTAIDALSTPDMTSPLNFTLRKGFVDVQLPFAGTFCAFSSPDVEDIAMVRFHVFAAPVVPRDAPSTVRIHVCPELPDQIEEMTISEQSEWGLTTCVGTTDAPFGLYQGSVFKLKYGGQVRTIKWHGTRQQAQFTYMPPDSDEEVKQVNEAILVDVLEGEGIRASRVAAVAKRAGISATDHPVPFELKLRASRRPNAPEEIFLAQRTQWDFTIQWREPEPLPAVTDSEPSITHYALELSVTGAQGTYGAFQEIWTGAGRLALPSVEAELAEASLKEASRASRRSSVSTSNRRGSIATPSRRGSLADPNRRMSVGDESRRSSRRSEADDDDWDDEEKPFTYTLEVDPGLFGRLRMRCWSDDELEPSKYSEEVKLPRFLGTLDSKGADRLDLEKRRKEYDKLTGRLIASKNDWSGSTPKDGEKKASTKKSEARLPCDMVPYDVPAPPNLPGVLECGARLADYFERAGVDSGGSGCYVGVSIDHILDAVARGYVIRAT